MSNPTMRDKLIKKLIEDEANRQFAYDDKTGKSVTRGSMIEGKVSVGIGRNLEDVGLRQDEIHYMLNNDLNEVEDQAKKFYWYWALSDNRKIVILSMIFNLGLAGFEKFKKTIHYIEDEQWSDAANEMMDSEWAKQVGVRAYRLSQMMEKDTFIMKK